MDITVTLDDGTEVTRPLDAVKLPDGKSIFDAGENGNPKGYVPRKELETQVQALKEQIVDVDSLLEQEETIRKIAVQQGWQLDDGLKPVAKLDEATKASLEAAWMQTHLKPKTKRIEELEAKVSDYEARQRIGKIQQLLTQPEHEIRDEQLDTLWDDETPAIVEQIAKRIKTDPQTGREYFLDEEGTPQFDNPYKSAVQAVYTRDAKNGFRIFKDNRQRGSDFSGSGGQRRTGALSLEALERGELSEDQLKALASGKAKAY